jgi:hypothetical protein
MAVVPTELILIRFEVLTAGDVRITVYWAVLFVVLTQLIKKTSDTACKFNQEIIDLSCSAILGSVHEILKKLKFLQSIVCYILYILK